jgi:hypothetical protein
MQQKKNYNSILNPLKLTSETHYLNYELIAQNDLFKYIVI